MKASCIALGALLFTSGLDGQQPRPEVIVVGTVHEPTPRFNEDSLVAILARVKPDLVLLELDPSFFDSSGALRERFRNVSLEARAAVAYARTNPVAIRPFDIEGRNRFYETTGYFENEVRLNQTISRLYDAGQLPAEARLTLEALRGFAAVRDACGAERAEIINSAPCDVALERKERYAFDGFTQIIAQTPALAEFREFWKTADEFWRRRTRAMVENIVMQSTKPGVRRVVVLTGFEHRFRLRDELMKRGLVVTNYFDH